MKVIVGTTIDQKNKESGRYTDCFSARFGTGEGCCFAYFRADPPNPALLPIFHNIKAELAGFAGSAPKDAKALEAEFEQMIGSLNEHLLEELEHSEDRRAFHLALGAALGGSLLLTGVGSLYATFMRPEQGETFHVYELFPKISETETEDKEKIFRAMISGELRPGDILGIAHTHTVSALGEKNWKMSIAEGHAAGAAAKLRARLNELEQEGGAMILNFEHGTESPESGPVVQKTSIETLRETAERTQKILRGSVLPAFFSGASKAGMIAANLLRSGGGRALRGLLQAAKRRGRGAFALGNPSHIIHSARAGSIGWPRRQLARDLSSAAGRLSGAAIDKFNTLPRFSKILSVLLLVAIVVFLQSIIYLGFRRNLETEQSAYNSAFEDIKNMKYEADASIIYNDEEKARELLLAAREKAFAIPQNSRTRRRQAGELLAFLDESLKKLRHEIHVLGEPVSDATPEVLALSLYRENAPRGISIASERILVLDGEGNLVELSADGRLNPVSADFPREEIADMELFGARLYVLAPSVPQIYRLGKAGSGFGSPATWVTAGSDYLRGTEAIAIDGAIYALAPNAAHKFFTGAREEWAPLIDPPLQKAEKIWTSDEAEAVYILEPALRRIIALSKQGALLAQYIFPEGSELKEFIVEKGEQSILVVNGDRIERVIIRNP